MVEELRSEKGEREKAGTENIKGQDILVLL